MKAYNHPLYNKILDFPFDPTGATFAFSTRLRQENGWNDHYTRRVLSEYRRFLFLAATAGHSVSPSDAVDQAWHLHMVYTRSYWTELCGETLGFPLHHGPTTGGKAESDKFTDWYQKTLEAYRLWFDEEPPADIWPAPSERFRQERNRFRRVNVSENWVIPKRLFRFSAKTAVVATVLLLPFALGATGGTNSFLWFLGALVVIGGLIGLASAQSTPQTKPRNTSSTGSAGDSGGIYMFGGDSGGDHGHGHGHSDAGGHGDSSSSDGGSSDGGSSDGGSSGCGGGCGGGCGS